MTRLEDALSLAARGWSVFPGRLTDDDPPKKVPANNKGFKGATLKTKPIEIQWRSDPEAYVAIALPLGVVALDVDKVDVFEAVGLEVPEGPGQETLSGGYHKLFRYDVERVVRQTVKEVPGADTRVGGLGYVFCWDAAAWPDVSKGLDALPWAPEWLYDHDAAPGAATGDAPSERRGPGGEVPTIVFKKGGRDNALAQFAGMMRKAGAGPDAIYAALKAMADGGQIEQTREDPITDKDLRRIARSIGGRQSDAVDAQVKKKRAKPERHMATDILTQDHGELAYFVNELIPEGVGIIGGAPKIGKSWLVLQAAMEIADGSGTLLDRTIPSPQPVLYYALEDGPRRAKKRMETLMGFHPIDVTMLEFRFEAPMLGEGLEEDIEEWVIANDGGVVFIDVLAMVQPEQAGRGSAYNAEYTMLKEIRDRIKRVRMSLGLAAAVVFVTHVRKMGADDPYATLQGTTGITGSTDWAWVIKRGRMDAKGTVQVNGRDIENEPFVEAIFNGAWTAVGSTQRGGSRQRNHILESLLTEGDLTTAQVRRYINDHVLLPDDTALTDNSVNEKLNAMEKGGLVEKTDKYVTGRGGGYVWHALSEDEITAVGRDQAVEAAANETASGHGRAPRIIRSRAGARGVDASASRGASRDKGGPQVPQVPRASKSTLMERMEGMDGAISRDARAVPRAAATRAARAHARGRAPSAPPRMTDPDDDDANAEETTP